MTRIIVAVTNDLVRDRRMQRICGSLSRAGYRITLVGRCYADSPPLTPQDFHQHRLRLWFRRGKLFYLEFHIRLFLYLLTHPAQAMCAVDLDTILPVRMVAGIRRIPAFFDAHEDYTGVPELIGRPRERKIWEWVARKAIYGMRCCYTVNETLAGIFSARYGKRFSVVRNVPMRIVVEPELPNLSHRILWYHGDLNPGRGLEEIISAIPALPGWRLRIAGHGVLAVKLESMVRKLDLSERVELLHWVAPDDLWKHMAGASIGLNLLDARSESYYHSLANKSFDYIQAGLPAIAMDFPEYRRLQDQGPIGVLVEDLSMTAIVEAVRKLEDPTTYLKCQDSLKRLRQVMVWEEEEKALVALYGKEIPIRDSPE